MPRFNGVLSWFVAFALIAGAGAVAWYGTAGGASASSEPVSQAVTIPAPVSEPSANSAAEDPAAAPPARLAGALPTRLVVESVGIDTSVDKVGVTQTADGTYTWETAWKVAGHHLDSARPGQPGNMVLSGHVSAANPDNVAIFENLSAVHEGDLVQVYSGSERFTYQVTEIRTVSPAEVSVLNGDHRSELTMITRTVDLEDRLVVVASLVS